MLDCDSGKHISMQIRKMLIAVLYLWSYYTLAAFYPVVGAPQISHGLFLQTGAGIISLLTTAHPDSPS